MNRKPNAKSHASAAAMFSAGVLLVPGLPATAQGAISKPAPPSQKSAAESRLPSIHFKFASKFDKWHGSLTAVGMLKERPVFKTAQGEFFQVEPITGDLKFFTPESLGYIKGKNPTSALSVFGFQKWTYKEQSKLSVLGVDPQGHVIQENSRGERFYLGAHGDMVFVK